MWSSLINFLAVELEIRGPREFMYHLKIKTVSDETAKGGEPKNTRNWSHLLEHSACQRKSMRRDLYHYFTSFFPKSALIAS